MSIHRLLLIGTIAVSLYRNVGGSTGKECWETPNVRTVLFRRSDLSKECWNREELALLFTRRMMQELVPRRVPRSVPLMLDYFKSCLETVKEMAPSRRSHALVLSALADTFGGYLQAYGLPATNEAYYEGCVDYCSAKQLHELEEAFKKTLRTDGGGWTRPMTAPRSPRLLPLPTPDPQPTDPCANLINNIRPQEYGGDEEEEQGIDGGRWRGWLRIGVPFLDDPRSPSAVAVPFRDRSLYSLTSKSSSDVLRRYYETGLACLEKEAGPKAAESFIANFTTWIEKSVLPHLHDETWYPGFGGVLRIMETVKRRGAGTYQPGQSCPKIEEESKQTSVLFYVAIVAAVLLAFWFIVFCVYIIYNLCARKNIFASKK